MKDEASVMIFRSVVVLALKIKGKKSYAEVAKIYSKNESSVPSSKKKKSMLVLLFYPKLQAVRSHHIVSP